MNGPVQMYRARQIVKHDIHVDLPDCMYKLKSIHSQRKDSRERLGDHVGSTSKKVDITEQINQSSTEMAALETRQQQILEQLADLKTQMETLKVKLSSSGNVQAKRTVANVAVNRIQVEDLPEIVISANPAFLPFSIQIVQTLWENYCWISVKSHVHSTVSALPDPAAQFSRTLEGFKPARNDIPKVHVRLLWKNVDVNPELIISHTVIVGEANILRYLSRIGPESLNYELSANATEVDSVLDTCYCLMRAKTKTERVALLQSIGKRLGKSGWLCGGHEFGVADIGVYSAVKQVASSELSVTLKKWVERCESVVCKV